MRTLEARVFVSTVYFTLDILKTTSGARVNIIPGSRSCTLRFLWGVLRNEMKGRPRAKRHKSLLRFARKCYADASRNDKPILRKSNDCPVCSERSFLFRSLCAVPTVFFSYQNVKGMQWAWFYSRPGLRDVKREFPSICFALNCFWIIFEILAPFYYADLFSFAFCLNIKSCMSQKYLFMELAKWQ